MRRFVACGLIASLLAGCATAPDPAGGPHAGQPEASIAFANQRATIREWQADGRNGIWVQDSQRNWYYGSFQAPCIGLDFANAVGFRTGSTGKLDRFATVVVPDEAPCVLKSFTRSQEPPDNGKRRKGDAAHAPVEGSAAE